MIFITTITRPQSRPQSTIGAIGPAGARTDWVEGLWALPGATWSTVRCPGSYDGHANDHRPCSTGPAMSGHTTAPPPSPAVSWNLIEETDGYTNSVAGATVEAVRTGKGVGPNFVLGAPGERCTITSSKVGFPMMNLSRIAEGMTAVAFMHETGEDSRWCGVGLRPGMVMVYGPGVEHCAVNRPGLHFTFVITNLEHVDEASRRADSPIRLPSDGGVQECDVSPSTLAFGHALAAFTSAAVSGNVLPRHTDDVLSSVAKLFGTDARRRGIGRGKGIDSRQIVHSCVEFATATNRVPSVGELCLAAHVSERRLRAAFTEEFDQPPSRYFRAWALDEAHRSLRAAAPGDSTVTTIAAGLGFNHLGRFAGQYKQIYGECPSSTLQLTEPRPS